MISEELKNKIIDYLDGVLDAGSEQEIEEILGSNNEANEFYNQLKNLDISLNESFQTSEYQAYSRQVDDKIDRLLAKQSVSSTEHSSFFKLFDISFKSSALLGSNLLTAAVFLFVGTLFVGDGGKGLEEFTSRVIDRDVFIFRSSNTENSIEAQFTNIINDLLDEKVVSARGKIGSNGYELNLEEIISVGNDSKCFKFELRRQNSPVKEVTYCKSGSDGSLITPIN